MSMINQAAANGEVSFAWHGGDISYADDWYSGVLPCEDDWPVCYNGSSSKLPPGDFPPVYHVPLPKGEIPTQGSPNGGDVSVIYESSWDLWQQWMNPITNAIPYMTVPGNHEATCMEFDGGANIMTAYMNNDEANSSAPASDLSYYSCPPSQRNFTAYQHRFSGMPGPQSGGVGNFWSVQTSLVALSWTLSLLSEQVLIRLWLGPFRFPRWRNRLCLFARILIRS